MTFANYIYFTFALVSAAFMAPEVITRNESEGSGRASDIWSLGCVVIQMATGKVGFKLWLLSNVSALNKKLSKFRSQRLLLLISKTNDTSIAVIPTLPFPKDLMLTA